MRAMILIACLLIIVMILLMIALIAAVSYVNKGRFKKLFHDKLEWHIPAEDTNTIFGRKRSVCIYCGREIE